MGEDIQTYIQKLLPHIVNNIVNMHCTYICSNVPHPLLYPYVMSSNTYRSTARVLHNYVMIILPPNTVSLLPKIVKHSDTRKGHDGAIQNFMNKCLCLAHQTLTFYRCPDSVKYLVCYVTCSPAINILLCMTIRESH